MTEDTELQGQITLLSDQGEMRSAFAVVEVQGVLVPLIVPATCIKLNSDSKTETKEVLDTREIPYSSAV